LEENNVTKINPIKSGLVLGAIFGLWHVIWSLLVVVGWAQPFIDVVFWMHFIKPVYVIQGFNPAIATALVVVTSAIGVFIGSAFAILCNCLYNQS
jgi:hypothetical protein